MYWEYMSLRLIQQKFYYYSYFSLNATVGGILFGLAFIAIAKRIDNQNIIGFMTFGEHTDLFCFIYQMR